MKSEIQAYIAYIDDSDEGIISDHNIIGLDIKRA